MQCDNDPHSFDERCIDNIEVIEYTEYNDEVQCKHSYSEQCHQTHIVDYRPEQKEECEEGVIKNCYIKFTKEAKKEKVRKCSQELVCAGEGPEICKMEHTTICESRQEPNEVTEDVANCKTVLETTCEDKTYGYETSRQCRKWPKVKCDVRNHPVTKFKSITECKMVPRQVCGPQGCILKRGEIKCIEETELIINSVSQCIYIYIYIYIYILCV